MNSERYRAIVNNLRAAIDESGMKQKAVAERAGMTQRGLNDILCFRKRLSPEDIPPLCAILNVTPDRFFQNISA